VRNVFRRGAALPGIAFLLLLFFFPPFGFRVPPRLPSERLVVPRKYLRRREAKGI